MEETVAITRNFNHLVLETKLVQSVVDKRLILHHLRLDRELRGQAQIGGFCIDLVFWGKGGAWNNSFYCDLFYRCLLKIIDAALLFQNHKPSQDNLLLLIIFTKNCITLLHISMPKSVQAHDSLPRHRKYCRLNQLKQIPNTNRHKGADLVGFKSWL